MFDHWGSRNAYSRYYVEYREDGCIEFTTAWSPVKPVLEKLSSMYPDLVFKYTWVEECMGNNCGKQTLKGGIVINEYIPQDTDEIWTEVV